MIFDRTAEIAKHLPFLRRFARAMTGGQQQGDRYVVAALEAILADAHVLDLTLPIKVGLYRVLYQQPFVTKASPNIADLRLANLTPRSRAALLLHANEEFSLNEVAQIMDVSTSEVDALIDAARKDLSGDVEGQIMIIEDEALIAMDLESLVSSLGHTVTGVARTHAVAVDLGVKEKPDLILADVRLADNSSGIDAVNDLLAKCGEIPVIFITAYPETLLTGKRPEPAFLITKPYTEEQVFSAVSQAMFFASAKDIQPLA